MTPSPQPALRAGAAASAALGALAGRRTVLVVDDDDSIRSLISVVLELEGYRVLQAPDGTTALALARDEQPDLVTLDVMMPGMDGWTVTRHLADDPATAGIPVMIVSGKPLAELERAADRHRVAMVLTKPFDFGLFTNHVATLLELPRPRRAPL